MTRGGVARVTAQARKRGTTLAGKHTSQLYHRFGAIGGVGWRWDVTIQLAGALVDSGSKAQSDPRATDVAS